MCVAWVFAINRTNKIKHHFKCRKDRCVLRHDDDIHLKCLARRSKR